MEDSKSASSGTSSARERPVAIALSLLDDLTTLQLASALELVERQLAALTSERERLAQKPGIAPERLAAFDASVAEAQRMLPALAGRFEQSRTAFPDLKPDAALIQGRVFYQESRTGLANATLLAQSPQGVTLAKTITDARGAFELSLSEKAAAAVVLEVRSGRSVLFTDAKAASIPKGQRTYREIGISPGNDSQPARKSARAPKET